LISLILSGRRIADSERHEGINIVTYYATTVLEDPLGFIPAVARLLTACSGNDHFAAAIVALFMVDRSGRHKMMMIGASGMAISALMVSECLSQITDTYKAPAQAATVFRFVFNSLFALPDTMKGLPSRSE
jgi:hypothetical protein